LKKKALPTAALTTVLIVVLFNLIPIVEAKTTVEDVYFRVTLDMYSSYTTFRYGGGWSPVTGTGSITVTYKGGLNDPQNVHIGVYVVDKSDDFTTLEIVYSATTLMSTNSTVTRKFDWILVDPISGPKDYLSLDTSASWLNGYSYD
jgi:hypothetical protein